jgi:hypothetical protein
VRRLFSRRPSPAMLVALLALFVALGGSSYAVSQMPNNSVGSNQLKNNAVTTQKIRNGAVTSSKVRNGSLMSADFKAGQLPGARNVRVVTNPQLLPGGGLPDGVVDPVATCPQGRVAIGGGGLVGGDSDAVPPDPPPDATWYLWRSHPVVPAAGGAPTAWRVSASDTGGPGSPQPAIAYVVCAAR